MLRKPFFRLGLIVFAVSLANCMDVGHAQQGIANWRIHAEKSLLGIWEKDESISRPYAIPKFKIWMESADATPKIQFLGRDTANDLHVLARSGAADPRATVVAFLLHKIGDDLVHVTLELRDDQLVLEGAKIVHDSREDINRFFGATYSRTSVFSMPVRSARRDSAVNPIGGRSDNYSWPTQRMVVKREPRVGKIVGQIDTRSTLRGTLTLRPYPKQASPSDGIKVGSVSPKFRFSNVPEGVYTLSFRGTVNGTSRVLNWKGLKIDVAGGKPSLSLKIR